VRLRLVALITAGLLGVLAQGASASSVRVVDFDCKYGCHREAQFRAGPGEANDVTVRQNSDASGTYFKFVDTGAPLSAGPGCRRVDDHTANCYFGPFDMLYDPSIVLGNLDDRLDASGLEFGGYGVTATGGKGSDTIIGSPASDAIDGGPGGDSLDGGGGRDGLVFNETAPGLRIDLGSSEPQGSPAAPDRYMNFEDVSAGRALGAVLIGDAGPNVLRAGPRGEVHGRGGSDSLYPGRGGRAYGGPGNDSLEADSSEPSKADRLHPKILDCGDGNDLTEAMSLFDVARESCELVSPDGTDGFVELHEQAGPHGPFATLRYGCLATHQRCPLTIWGRLGSTHGTVVMKRRVKVPPGARDHFYALRLNARGRSLLRERGRLRVIVYYRIDDPEYGSDLGFSMILRAGAAA
jgi:hypothetical protein